MGTITKAIEAVKLKKYFKKKIKALEEINLEVKFGEIVGLLGPNGAGKTTILRILATSVLPTSGHASVNGYSVLNEVMEVRNSIGMVTGEGRSFYWRLSGRQNLDFFGRLYGLSGKGLDRKKEELIDLLEIKDPDKRAGLYSTGNMQRLAFARAFLNDPQVLLLDEPFKDLDPLTIERTEAFLKDKFVRRYNKAILLATHNLEQVKEFCDRAIIIKEGSVAANINMDASRNDIRYIYRRFIGER